MNDVLSKILATKRQEVDAAMATCALSAQYRNAQQQAAPRGFVRALRDKSEAGAVAVIAEIKKASPSKGLLRAEFYPGRIAGQYAAAGAACLSVLTDRDYFMGSQQHLLEARAAVDLPVLRKDFMIDPYQIVESRAMGADCVLLIVAALVPSQMRELAVTARELGMDVLVEVHDEDELGRAIDIEGGLIGVNNRDLRTFNTDIAVSTRLIKLVPQGRMVVSESGLSRREDIDVLLRAGIGAFLIGEAFMRSHDPGAALSKMISA